eukprot:Platyproteum_vivax@DN1217_c0_g1_i1.p1
MDGKLEGSDEAQELVVTLSSPDKVEASEVNDLTDNEATDLEPIDFSNSRMDALDLTETTFHPIDLSETTFNPILLPKIEVMRRLPPLIKKHNKRDLVPFFVSPQNAVRMGLKVSDSFLRKASSLEISPKAGKKSPKKRVASASPKHKKRPPSDEKRLQMKRSSSDVHKLLTLKKGWDLGPDAYFIPYKEFCKYEVMKEYKNLNFKSDWHEHRRLIEEYADTQLLVIRDDLKIYGSQYVWACTPE